MKLLPQKSSTEKTSTEFSGGNKVGSHKKKFVI